jgi:transposase-like protein
METNKTSKSFSPEVRERAVRMVREHLGEYGSEWEAVSSIASKIGCTGESLRRWVRQAERDAGERAGDLLQLFADALTRAPGSHRPIGGRFRLSLPIEVRFAGAEVDSRDVRRSRED